MSASPEAHAFWRRPLLPALALGSLALAAYANSFSGAFILDDQSSIVRNAGILRVWPPWAPLMSGSGGTRGRPIANLSFALNHSVGGLTVPGYHAVNLLIHILAGLALFGVLRRTLLRPAAGPHLAAVAGPLAFAGAALWLVHPLLTESVTYLSQRTESLMGLFYLAAMYCVIRGAESEPPGRWYALAVASSYLGMASKEVMVTAPVVILLYDRTFLAGSFGSAWVLRKRLYLGLASGWILLAFLMNGVNSRGAGLGLGVTPAGYALREGRAIIHYLALAFWPQPLVFDYGAGLGPPSPATVPCAFAIAALAVLAVALLRYRPAVGFALFAFLALLAPTSSFVPVALQPVAENRMYLPLIPVVALAVGGLYLALGRWSWIALAALAACLCIATHRRNEDYRTAVGIWMDTVAKCPSSARAHCNLGTSLLADNQTDLGLFELNQALRISPADPDANLDLGVALANQGRLEEASARIQAAVGADPSMPEAHFNLGWLDAKAGKVPEALGEYDRAIALRPDYYDAHCNVADLLTGAGRFPDAIPHYEAALAIGPQSPELYYNLAYACARTGRVPDAIADFAQALRLKPDYAEARHNLEILEAAAGRRAGGSPPP